MFNTELSPVQIMYLKSPSKFKIDEALGYVIKDLVLRRVFAVEKFQSFPNDRSRKTQKYFRIVKSINFEGYEAATYEKSTIAPFTENNQIQTKILTNFILKEYGTPSAYIADQIFTPLKKEGYISSLPILKSFGYFKLSSKGKTIVSELNEFLNTQQAKLEGLIDGDKAEFIDVLEQTGTYVFYFEKHNLDLYKNIISMIKRINRTKPLGPEKDLQKYTEAMNIDLDYFIEH